jgi:hypothetical protein
MVYASDRGGRRIGALPGPTRRWSSASTKRANFNGACNAGRERRGSSPRADRGGPSTSPGRAPSNLGSRIRLYAAAARVEAQPTRAIPRQLVLAWAGAGFDTSGTPPRPACAPWLAREPGWRTVRRLMRMAERFYDRPGIRLVLAVTAGAMPGEREDGGDDEPY